MEAGKCLIRMILLCPVFFKLGAEIGEEFWTEFLPAYFEKGTMPMRTGCLLYVVGKSIGEAAWLSRQHDIVIKRFRTTACINGL